MATARTSINKALSEKFKTEINGVAPFVTNIFSNSYPVLKFWDEVNDFPCIYMIPGGETREYHPAGFAWGHFSLLIKAYCKGENSQEELEDLIGDIERSIDNNREIVYDTDNNYSTTEILLDRIITDEGLLAPYAVGEVTAMVRYQVIK